MKSLTVLAGVIFLAVASSPKCSAADPFAGTWRLNASKTEYSNPPQVQLIPIKNGISFQSNQQLPYVAYFNGRDYPFEDGTTISAVRVSERTLVSTMKRNGKVITRSTLTVSPDGKSATTVVEEPGVKESCKRVLLENRLGEPASGDAFLGTWQQDPTNTKFEPPLTYLITISGNRLDVATGCGTIVRAKLDGRTRQDDSSNSILQATRADERRIAIVRKPEFGSPTTTEWEVNGNSLTVTLLGNGAEGKPFKRVQHFERVD